MSKIIWILILLSQSIFTFSQDCNLAIGVDKTDETELLNDGTAKANIWDSGYKVTTASITWSTGDTTDYIDELTPGNYYVSAVDTQGCVAESYFTIYEYIPCDYSNNVHIDGDNIWVDNFGELHPSINTSYQWSTGETSNYITTTTSGVYTVTITNNGCSDVVEVNMGVTGIRELQIDNSVDYIRFNLLGQTY
jgi:hypothetical protein